MNRLVERSVMYVFQSFLFFVPTRYGIEVFLINQAILNLWWLGCMNIVFQSFDQHVFPIQPHQVGLIMVVEWLMAQKVCLRLQ